MHEKLSAIFAESLNIPVVEITDELKYAEHPHWDSIAHMTLIAAIEDGFEIMIDAEDVIGMSSFLAAKEIVAKHI